MKSLHVPYTYYPDPCGGTEVYVESLTRGLRGAGWDALVAAPGGSRNRYGWDGVPVFRFPSSVSLPLQAMYGEGDPLTASAFASILDVERPDIVHLHALTAAVSVLLVRAAKRRGIPTVFTYHTPTVSCTRGTLLIDGRHECDGVMQMRRCTGCTARGLGAPWPAARFLASPAAGPLSRILPASQGRFNTAVHLRDLVAARHTVVREVLASVDRVVAPAVWVRELLLRNGVPPERVLLCRHGVSFGTEPDRPVPYQERARPLRVAFFGRLDPAKGVDLLLAAMRGIPGVAVRLDVFGVDQVGTDTSERVERCVGRDARTRFLPPVKHERIRDTIRAYDVVAVPSRSIETGPLIALEALAAGVPVLASDLGGLREHIRHGVNGLLLDPFDPCVWADTLRALAEDSSRVRVLASYATPLRDENAIAGEMNLLYHSLLGPAHRV